MSFAERGGALGAAGQIILVWRSPTETLILSAGAAPLEHLLLFGRVYAEHFVSWIGTTIEDFS
jgi:hypothetical protein